MHIYTIQHTSSIANLLLIFCYLLVNSNTGTGDLVTWPSICKLFESMEYTNAQIIQQGVTPIDAFTKIRLYC